MLDKGMLEELRTLLGMEIDLVMAGAVKNLYIARDIERMRRMLYAASCPRLLVRD